jgi:hypothetical protein
MCWLRITVFMRHYARVALGSGTFLDKPPFNLPAEEVLNVRQADGLTSLRTIVLCRTKL